MSYKNLSEVQNAFTALAEAYPSDITLELLGYSVQNRPIFAAKIGNSNGRKIMIDCSIHGAEILNTELAYRYAQWLLTRAEPSATKIMAECQTIIVPVVNPDGYTRCFNRLWGDATRKNANGGDLNRNVEKGWCGGSDDPAKYNYKGTAALSEPETKAIRAFLEKEKPRWFLSMHLGEPYRIYKQNSGKPVEYRTHIQNTINKYKEIAKLRGLDSSEYTETWRGSFGGEVDDASALGAYGLLCEWHAIEATLRYDDPPFSAVDVWLQKFLPLAIAVSEVEYVPPPSQQSITPIILAVFAVALLSMILITKK